MTSAPTIGINEFVRRQTKDSEFTHFDGTWGVVLELVYQHFDEGRVGYREGTWLVPVPPESFYCGVVDLREGDALVGEFKARRPGEEPRKTLLVAPREGGRTTPPGPATVLPDDQPEPTRGDYKSPCMGVDVVLYSRELLESNGETCTGADWDIISVNGRTTEGEMPIEPMTLIANHFVLDGGTPTGMTPEEFEAALKESVLFWKDKALMAPP